MTVDRARVARIAAPVAFLVAMTIAVLVVRAALREDEPPPPPGARASLTDGATVVVRAGDTLEGIARTAGTTVEAIVRLNPGIDPEALRVGRRVRVGRG